jgi:hypothetical protein
MLRTVGSGGGGAGGGNFRLDVVSLGNVRFNLIGLG